MAGFFETYVDPLNKVIEEKDAEIKKVIKERDTEKNEMMEKIEKMKAEITRLGGNAAIF